MKIKQIEYSKKVGQPNFGSVGFAASADVGLDENLEKAIDELKQFVDKHTNPDQSWMSSDPKAKVEQSRIDEK